MGGGALLTPGPYFAAWGSRGPCLAPLPVGHCTVPTPQPLLFWEGSKILPGNGPPRGCHRDTCRDRGGREGLSARGSHAAPPSRGRGHVIPRLGRKDTEGLTSASFPASFRCLRFGQPPPPALRNPDTLLRGSGRGGRGKQREGRGGAGAAEPGRGQGLLVWRPCETGAGAGGVIRRSEGAAAPTQKRPPGRTDPLAAPPRCTAPPRPRAPPPADMAQILPIRFQEHFQVSGAAGCALGPSGRASHPPPFVPSHGRGWRRPARGWRGRQRTDVVRNE